MKQYQVYGIGNALVDVEFNVTEDFFKEMKIEKGLMTLVDENRQTELMSKLQGKEIAKRPGGSAANTMIAISQFGGKSFYAYKVAKDDFGASYLRDLMSNGVTTKISEQELGVTGKCMVFITPDADRTMNTFLGITESFSNEEIDTKAMLESQWLYIEGYLVPSKTGLPAAVFAKKLAETSGVKTALTFSDPNMVKYFRKGIDEIIGNGVDLLFCNEDEALAYTNKTNVHDACEDLKKVAKTFAVTVGPKGALVYDGKDLIHVESRSVKAIDTNGAGDLFAGAFLYAITNGHDYKKAGQFACYASSVIVTQHGARLEKAKAKEIQKEFFCGR